VGYEVKQIDPVGPVFFPVNILTSLCAPRGQGRRGLCPYGGGGRIGGQAKPHQTEPFTEDDHRLRPTSIFGRRDLCGCSHTCRERAGPCVEGCEQEHEEEGQPSCPLSLLTGWPNVLSLDHLERKRHCLVFGETREMRRAQTHRHWGTKTTRWKVLETLSPHDKHANKEDTLPEGVNPHSCCPRPGNGRL
jgi:hypothetical protein